MLGSVPLREKPVLLNYSVKNPNISEIGSILWFSLLRYYDLFRVSYWVACGQYFEQQQVHDELLLCGAGSHRLGSVQYNNLYKIQNGKLILTARRSTLNKRNLNNSNYVPFPLHFTTLFSHFYSVNLNSNNSNSPLT